MSGTHGSRPSRLRLLRIVAIAVSAIILCSCRPVATALVTTALFDAPAGGADCPVGDCQQIGRAHV